jgi:hypothetical protein
MTQLHVEVSAVIEADRETVYGILRDYRNHHPQILPKAYFTSLEIEQNGLGKGTIFIVEMKAYGQKVTYRMEVTEPQPFTLVEADLHGSTRTTFRVEPGTEAGQSVATISTTWQRKPGLAGWIEQLTTPPIMRKIYREELAILNRYAQSVREPQIE